MIKFEQTGRRPDGEKIYRLVINDRVIREGMTLDEVIVEIQREDEENLGARHTPRPVREPAAERRRMALDERKWRRR